MLSEQPSPLSYLKAILVGEIGLSEKSAAQLIDEHGELDVQWRAMYCLWTMQWGKVRSPSAWLTASMKGEWSASHVAVPWLWCSSPQSVGTVMPSEWLPTALNFRVDESTFEEFTREMRKDKKST